MLLVVVLNYQYRDSTSSTIVEGLGSGSRRAAHRDAAEPPRSGILTCGEARRAGGVSSLYVAHEPCSGAC